MGERETERPGHVHHLALVITSGEIVRMPLETRNLENTRSVCSTLSCEPLVY